MIRSRFVDSSNLRLPVRRGPFIYNKYLSFQRGKEEAVSTADNLDRTKSDIEALKTSFEAKEKAMKRTEERFEEDAKDWKEKESCYEAQLLEMQQLRDQVDQLSTLNYSQTEEGVSKEEASRKEEGMEGEEVHGVQIEKDCLQP